MQIEEQQTEQAQSAETTTPELGGPSRDDLIAAVREAGGTASVSEQVATEAAAKNDPPAEPEPEKPAEEDRLEKLLKLHQQKHLEQQASRSSAQQLLDQAKAESQRVLEEARAEARKIIERETTAHRERFRASPVEALRALGDPQEVVDAALRAGSPEARAQAKFEADLATARKDAAEGKGAAEELKRMREEMARERQQAAVHHAQQVFLNEHASAEKAPYLHARFDAAEIFDRADALCKQWEASGLVFGGQGENGFAPSDLVAYLERQSKERVSKLIPQQTPPAQQVAAGAPSKAPGNAPQVQANGPRTLSAAQGSERRTSPKPLHEMTDAQARQALIEEVAAARRNNPDAAF